MPVLEFMSKWEPIWLPLLLLIEIGLGIWTVHLGKAEVDWAQREYEYDEQKDLAKKQHRTRTTKKTTTNPGGSSVVEETNEVTEPIIEDRKEKGNEQNNN